MGGNLLAKSFKLMDFVQTHSNQAECDLRYTFTLFTFIISLVSHNNLINSINNKEITRTDRF